MIRNQQPAVTLFAIGLIGLGILSLVYHDFAMQWQPVPASIPGRSALAYASGLLMVIGGVALLFKAIAAPAIRILFPYLIIWQLLKVPALIVAPQVEGVWLGFAEITVLLAGGWVLFARLAELDDKSFFRHIVGENGIRIARILFAVALIPIGLSHIVYIKITASLVPAWLPFRAGWGYATGIGQIACGLGVLFSIYPRLAAMVETGMLAVFAFLVWAPRIVAAPTSQLPWTAFFITWVIGASAWLVAINIPPRRKGDQR